MSWNDTDERSSYDGMVTTDAAELLEKAARLLPEMRESTDLCSRLMERLRFLRDEFQNPSNRWTALKTCTMPKHFELKIDLVSRFLEEQSTKNLLQRLGSCRALQEQVRILHAQIDFVFECTGLSSASVMTDWRQQEAGDISTQYRLLEDSVRWSADFSVDNLPSTSLAQTLAELKIEIDNQHHPESFRDLMAKVLGVVEVQESTTILEKPNWFIHREDVEVGEVLGKGSFGAAHKGVWRDKEVCVKLLYKDGVEMQKSVLREAAIWFSLSHQNTLRMLGGCYVGKELFFVSELASQGNFVNYFNRPENRNKIWRLFYQAAQGLKYLHSENIIHGSLRCNNLLVDEDGSAKVSDFDFSYVRNRSLVRETMEMRPFHWAAPECMLNQEPESYPTFKSDVYSLGMSIIEARIGGRPWGWFDESDIIEEFISGERGYPRPEGSFTDKEWRLVEELTVYEPYDRMTTEEALEALAVFAREEEESEKKLAAERQVAIEKEFESGSLNEREEDHLERVAEFIQRLPDEKDQESRDMLVQHVRQVQFWTKQEAVERRDWEVNAPTTSTCGACGSLNPLDNPFCCDCGSPIDGYRNREEATFRFALPHRSDLEEAIRAFETLVGTAESYRSSSVMCPECGTLSPVGRRFCTGCVSRLDTAKPLQAHNDPVHIAVMQAIDRLKVVRQNSKAEEARLRSLKKEEPELRACDRCGEMNPKDEIFCRECGADTEIIRGFKL